MLLSSYLVYFVTLVVPALLAWILRKRVDPRHRPILVFLWLLLAWEIMGVFTPEASFWKIFASNTQGLFESLIIIWVAYQWRVLKEGRMTYFLLAALVVGTWGMDILINGLHHSFFWVNVGFSILNICLGMLFLGRTQYKPDPILWKNPIYLFGMGLVFHYLLAATLEGLILISRPTKAIPQQPVFYALAGIGIITNLIYLKTILCISKVASSSYA